ncbi:MAG: glycosyltransferase family 2 protein [Acidobacteria bacterium]|nr:glycosyltransferase family 2 protein [Acidobacteriota bacterium]
MPGALGDAIRIFDLFMIGYFAVLAVIYTALAFVGWRSVEDYVARRPMRDYNWVGRSPLSLPVSILAPAYNEGPVIVPAMRALMASQFVNFEVIVINDGSKDDTLHQLKDGFGLVPASRVPRANLVTKAVRDLWMSPTEPRIVVIDKENGGKADALNVGLRYARNPLVCAIDADTILDPGALSRLVWEFQSSPDTIATGGIVRIVNGSTVVDGRVIEVKTPTSILANIQILEYLRAFLGARVGWSRLRMLMIISGAFGLFRRDAVIEAGGWDTSTVGEDAELVLRLHRTRLEQGKPCRITFFPDPICWTEAPGDLRTLIRQRDRWQRGLIEMLGRHRRMIGNPRYGRLGMIALPYFVIFELFGPVIEVFGYAALLLSIVFGLASPQVIALMFALAVSYGFVLSFLAILMEQRAFRRYPGWRCLGRLVAAAVVENVAYRQVMTIVRARSWWTYRRSAGSWGEMTRAGFGAAPIPATVPSTDGVLLGD